MSGRYALIGHPVAHSLSPRIHAAFGAQCGIALEYGLIDVAPEGFDAAVAAFAKGGGAGLNVTLPFKVDAFDFGNVRLSLHHRLLRSRPV